MPEPQIKNLADMARNYLRALFDFSFSRYITIQMLPMLYGLMILASLVNVVHLVIDAFDVSMARGWVYLLLSPFALIVMISVFRGLLEFLVVTFRIAEDIEKLSGMRESVDKISGIADFSSLTSRIPFVRLLQNNRPRRDDENHDSESR